MEHLDETVEWKNFSPPDEVREFPGPGDVSLLPSGHDAWVVSDELAIVIDFQGMIDYARSH